MAQKKSRVRRVLPDQNKLALRDGAGQSHQRPTPALLRAATGTATYGAARTVVCILFPILPPGASKSRTRPGETPQPRASHEEAGHTSLGKSLLLQPALPRVRPGGRKAARLVNETSKSFFA